MTMGVWKVALWQGPCIASLCVHREWVMAHPSKDHEVGKAVEIAGHALVGRQLPVQHAVQAQGLVQKALAAVSQRRVGLLCVTVGRGDKYT